jgi:DNA end-binding protein Ku
MPGRKKLPEQEDKELRQRAIWSGTVSFGLVNIPVAVFPGHRSHRARMRMLSPEGRLLSRKYYCPAENRPIDPEEIIRGYEIEKGKFITVTDDELNSLQPSKSREIDLLRFVPVNQIDPKFMERAYFMIPLTDSVKPYRLLAETMEKTGKAGIATFVMRGKEYLVAILAENRVLIAETLRFTNEIRNLDIKEISSNKYVNSSKVDAMVREIKAATTDHIELHELEDEYTDRLIQLANKKRSERKDVLSSAEVEKQSRDTDNVIDLMQILKRSMEKESSRENKTEEINDKPLDNLSKAELYDKAKQLQIPGRSRMGREELIEAIHNF